MRFQSKQLALLAVVWTLCLWTLCLGVADAVADDKPAGDSSAQTPSYPAPIGAIITGLKGVGSGTKSMLDSYRATMRMLLFRQKLAEAMLNASDPSKPIRLTIGNDEMLCKMRENYAQVNSEAAFINSVTGAFDTFATAPKITSLGQAFMSLFTKYTLDVKGDPAQSAPAGEQVPNTVLVNCKNDLSLWKNSYFNFAAIEAKKASFETLSFGNFSADVTSVSGLAGAIYNIVNPIADALAQYDDEQHRDAVMVSTLRKVQDDLLKAAQALAQVAATAANTGRFQAVGQFANKMSAPQFTINLPALTYGTAKTTCDKAMKFSPATEKVDVTTSDVTKAADDTLYFQSVPSGLAEGMTVSDIDKPAAIPPNTKIKSTSLAKQIVTMSAGAATGGVANGDNIEFSYSTVTDEFGICYEEAWQQIGTAASDAVTAASAYDTLADVRSDKIEAAVLVIQKELSTVGDDTAKASLVHAATELAAFAKTLETALSSDNLTKLKSQEDALKKQFGIK